MAEAKSLIAFDQAGLGSVIKNNQLVVPSNQREYAWTDREVRQLFQDYARAMTDGTDYFLGTIVTIPRDGNLEVVDGQQRLATTAILLAAIRDYLKEQGDDVLVESINNEFLTGIDRSRRVRVSKLRLNIDDNEHFTRIVSAEPLPPVEHPSHQRLRAAYQEAKAHVKRVVAPLDRKDHGDLLNAWVSFIEDNALVVLLKVPGGADAYRMFETLNDRGLRTNQVDLIKNYLFGHSGDREPEVQAKWAFMRGTLEALEDEDITIDFLRHALIVQRGHLREAQVYDTVQDTVKGEQGAVTFVSLMDTLATVYAATCNPESERWNQYPDSARRAIEVFNLLNIKPLRPLLLAVAYKMPEKDTEKTFRFLISAAVRILVASSTRSGAVETRLAQAAHGVYAGTIATVADLQRTLDPGIPNDVEFKEAFATAKVSNARFARYYLRSLEMTANEEKEPWFVPTNDRNVINLEHILPLKSEENWPTFSEDDARNNVTRLGNLALMRASDNAGVRSAGFETKRKIYADSPYLLTSQIAEVNEWTPAAVAARQNRLAELAVKTWPTKI